MPETTSAGPGAPPAWVDVEARARTWIARAGLPAATTVTRLAGDASDRCFVRIAPPDGTTRILVVHAEPIRPAELPLVTVAALLREVPVPVPDTLGVDAELGIVVLEDLGDATLEAALAAASSDRRDAWYREAVDLVVALQQGGPRIRRPDALPFRLAFDIEKLTWELQFFREHYLDGYRRLALAPALRDALAGEFRTLAEQMAAEPRVLCHRDFHSRNLMLHADRLYVIDFQDARMGPDTYDLVSLLRDAYVELDGAVIDRCLDHYRQSMGVTDGAALRRRFIRTTVQRSLKALGTFGYQITVRHNDRYAGAVRRALHYARGALELDPDRQRLRDLLVPLLDGDA
ncbi:MAG: phosphotransferase [Acidobacteria bacterium]|nr:phosphotransferase [Acidobacteriota bacterium]